MSKNTSKNNNSTKLDKTALIPAAILMVFGLLFIIFGVQNISKNWVDSSWTRIDGVVSSYEKDPVTEDYNWLIAYSVNNKQYVVTETSSVQPTVGRTERVAYNPSNPEQSKVDQGIFLHIVLAVIPLLGIIMLLAAPIGYRRFKTFNALVDTAKSSKPRRKA